MNDAVHQMSTEIRDCDIPKRVSVTAISNLGAKAPDARSRTLRSGCFGDDAVASRLLSLIKGLVRPGQCLFEGFLL